MSELTPEEQRAYMLGFADGKDSQQLEIKVLKEWVAELKEKISDMERDACAMSEAIEMLERLES